MDSHSADIVFALVAIATFAGAFIFPLLGAKPAPIAPRSIASRKHVRHTVWSDSVTVAYYGHNGKRITSRNYPLARYRAVMQSARAKGYRVI